MDADDIALPDRLRRQVDFLNAHPEYLMCGTNAAVIDNRGKRTGIIRNLVDDDFLRISLLFSPSFVHPSMMIRSEVLQRNRYDEDYKHVEDYELWCRIARQGKIANLNSELLEYRRHDSNVSVLNSKVQDELKDKIMTNELKRLDIVPTADELFCHTITFRLYHLGRKTDVSVTRFEAVAEWFAKLICQNRQKGVYNRNNFAAFLWARWIVLCVSQKKYGKVIPPFASFRPAILGKLVKLMLFLKDK
jgi:hypothetical protein